jgi:PilZ domain
MPTSDERRDHTRFPLRVFAAIGNASQEWAVHVLDISAQGTKVALLDDFHFSPGDPVQLRIELPNKKVFSEMPAFLQLEGTIAHTKQHIIGIQYHPKTPEDEKILAALIKDLI